MGPSAGTADFQTGIKVTAATGILCNNYHSRDGTTAWATDGAKISVYQPQEVWHGVTLKNGSALEAPVVIANELRTTVVDADDASLIIFD